MFKKGIQGGTKDVETVIGSSVKVEGNFVCEGNMVIDGEVKGNVKTKGFLRIGDKAVIVADIEAANAYISGQIKGNIKVADYLEVDRTAKIFGDVTAVRLSVAEGAFLNGKYTMIAKDGQRARAIKKEAENLSTIEETVKK